MSLILGTATILGGIAALWFFWDRITGRHPNHPSLPQPSATPLEELVDFNYPKDSGLQSKLEAEGYRWYWTSREKLSRRIDLEGWEHVEVGGQRLTTGDLVLIKKRAETSK